MRHLVTLADFGAQPSSPNKKRVGDDSNAPHSLRTQRRPRNLLDYIPPPKLARNPTWKDRCGPGSKNRPPYAFTATEAM